MADKQKKKSYMELVEGSFPSDEELQARKAERRNWVSKLREKGLPEKVAKGIEYISDTVTPDTREEYMEGLATSMGTVGRTPGFAPSKMAVSQEGKSRLSKLARSMPAEKSAALEGSEEALKRTVDELADAGTFVKPGQLNRAAEINKIKLKNEVRSNPSKAEAPLDYKQINNASSKPAAKESISYSKISPGEVNPKVKDLQLDLQVANDMGDYKKAKAIQAEIRKLRGGK